MQAELAQRLISRLKHSTGAGEIVRETRRSKRVRGSVSGLTGSARALFEAFLRLETGRPIVVV
ncbi:MAG: hypothetical protein V2A71_08395, partial [Candidatus Eisenbacteria bacterium]